jgi:hypothetical protein
MEKTVPTPLETQAAQANASTGADHQHPLDAVIPDPSGMEPMCGEGLFAQIMEEMVADSAPRVFAVVQEYGERVDMRIAGWGLAFPDHARAVSVDDAFFMKSSAPEDTLSGFRCGSHVTPRLVWVDPAAATPGENDAD